MLPARKLRDDIRLLLTPPKLLSYLHILRDNIWPQGKLKPQGIPRTTEEKLRTRDEANRKLSSLVPGAIDHNPDIAISDDWSKISPQT